jgi:hypothetical protein
MNLRSKLLESIKSSLPRREAVTRPSGETVYAQEFNAGEMDRFESEHAEAGRQGFRSRLIVHGVRDEEGRPVFQPEDLEAVAALPWSVAEPLAAAVVRVNKLGADYEGRA